MTGARDRDLMTVVDTLQPYASRRSGQSNRPTSPSSVVAPQCGWQASTGGLDEKPSAAANQSNKKREGNRENEFITSSVASPLETIPYMNTNVGETGHGN